MTEDEILRILLQRADDFAPSRCAPARMQDIQETERLLGFPLPSFYVRLLTEVGNGGFGPGYGIIGVPPDGYRDSDLNQTSTEAYLEGRACDDPAYRTPRGLIFLCSWGCGTFSYVDCLSPESRILTDECLQTGLEYVETCTSLREWLERWLTGCNLWEEMHEVLGYREGLNPFTGEPLRLPIRRLRGSTRRLLRPRGLTNAEHSSRAQPRRARETSQGHAPFLKATRGTSIVVPRDTFRFGKQPRGPASWSPRILSVLESNPGDQHRGPPDYFPVGKQQARDGRRMRSGWRNGSRTIPCGTHRLDEELELTAPELGGRTPIEG